MWIPKYRKRVLTGEVAVRVRDLIRQIALEHELVVLSGKVARDHVHVFVSYRPNQDISTIVQWLKGISSRVLLQEFPHLRKAFWGKHFGSIRVSQRHFGAFRGLVPHTNVCTIQPPAGQPRRGKRLRMCSCPRISGEVVYRSVDGRLRGPRFWWGACSTAAGPTSRC